MSNGDRPSVENWAILVQDGPSSNPQATALQANLTRLQGIRLFAVGVTDYWTNPGPELSSIAASSADIYRFNYSQLVNGFTDQFICAKFLQNGSLTY